MLATRSYVPAGDLGTEWTLRSMERVVDRATRDGAVVRWAQDVVRGVPERDKDAEALALLTWVRSHARYTNDPIGVEVVKEPSAQLRELQEHGSITSDCDDQVVLLSAGLRCVGIDTRFVVVSGPGDTEYTHVLMEYDSPSRGWVSIDPIIRQTGIGWFPPDAARVGVGSRDGTIRSRTPIWGILGVIAVLYFACKKGGCAGI